MNAYPILEAIHENGALSVEDIQAFYPLEEVDILDRLDFLIHKDAIVYNEDTNKYEFSKRLAEHLKREIGYVYAK